MLFNSFTFAAFFIIVLALYWLLNTRAQNRMLLVASYIFYGAWDWRFLFLLLLSTLVDYYVGLRLGGTSEARRRRQLLLVSVVAQLGILGFFKYFSFFAESAVDLSRMLGIHLDPITLKVILPIGISFYTFQTMSYTIDVYRGRLRPTADFLDFALFVAFFPQLLAGPISKATHLLPQLQRTRTLSLAAVQSGTALIIVGLFRKVVIADLAAPVVNRIFASPGAHSWASLVLASAGFGLQIYGDFAGYSDIARGTSRLLGIELIRNFRQPYLSRSITEFWRRWHISLSTWLRDYLYVPLGGSRRGAARTYANLTIVMLLGGLWHGAAWTFVAWGAFHGLLLAMERILRVPSKESEQNIRLQQLPAILLTLTLVLLGWIFFRAPSIQVAGDVIQGIFTLQTGFFTLRDVVTLGVLAVFCVAIDLMEKSTEGKPLMAKNPLALGIGLGACTAALLVVSGSEVIPFIYFQF